MKYLKIFCDFADDIEDLGDAERGRLFTAMLKYAASGEDADLRGNERFLWKAAKRNIDSARETYERRVQIMANAREAINNQSINSQLIDAQQSINSQLIVQDKDKDKDKENYSPPIVPPKGRTKRRNAAAHGYQQREYGPGELDHVFVDLDGAPLAGAGGD